MILGFKPQFVEKILDGTKIHTIRQDIHGRWKEGRGIQFATGVRTPNYKCFKVGVCQSTQKISIRYREGVEYPDIYVDEENLWKSKMVGALSRNDGFPYILKLIRWFNKDFTGKIIHWTDYRY
mgnify:CR=1 FL=1